MAQSETAVVCDAGPLIHLDELAAHDLLCDFAEVFVPDAVWREVERHRPQALHHTDVALTRVSVDIEEDAAFTSLAQALSLDSGEREAIQLTRQKDAAILLTDDAAARLAAESLNLRVHGTIGILLRAIRRNRRTPSDAVTLIEQIPDRSSLYIRPELLADIVRQVKTEYGL